MSIKAIHISLTNNEALVLFEMLSRFTDTEKLSIDHQAEERVLWNLTSLLEKELSEPLSANYNELIIAAREKIKDQQG